MAYSKEQKEDIVKKTEQYANATMDYGPGHDWEHTKRVRRLALLIANNEAKAGRFSSIDLFVVELAALLHDVDDWKFMTDGKNKTNLYLDSIQLEKAYAEHICEICQTLSFKGAEAEKPMSTPEGKCVRDADRLDGIGAIGIARTFDYGGLKQRPFYSPDSKPSLDAKSFVQLSLKGGDTSIQHFYDKLLRVKGFMETETGKKIAAPRHEAMLKFLEQFMSEWEGRDFLELNAP